VTSEKHAQDRAKYGRHIVFMFSTVLLTHLVSLIRLPALTKSLGPSLFGTWSLIGTTVSLVVPFAAIAFGTSIVRFLAAEKDRARIRDDFLSASVIVFFSGAAFSLVMWLSSGFLATTVLREASSAPYFRLASVLILLRSITQLPLAYFRMQRRMVLFATATFLQNLIQVALITAVVLLHLGLPALIWVTILSELAFYLAIMAIAMWNSGVRPPTFRRMGTYLRWGIPLTPNTALLWIMNASDRYLVGFFKGSADVGVYAAAYSIGSYAILFASTLRTVTYPNIVKSFDEGFQDETKRYLSDSFRLLMAISIPSAIGLSMLARPLLAVLTTAQFTGGAWVVPLVAFANVAFAMYQIPISVFHIVNQTHRTVRLLGLSAFLNVGLNLLLIPRMGIVGAALATLVAYGTLGVLTLIQTRRILRFSLHPVFLLKVVLSSAVMAIGVWAINPSSLVCILVAVCAGGLIYVILMLITGAISESERTIVIKQVRGFFRGVAGRFPPRRQ